MRILETASVAVLALSLSGCVIGKKPQAAATTPPPPAPAVQAPPPEPAPTAPLSTPQTVVLLPKQQPLSNEAIASTQAPEEVPYTPPPSNRKNNRPSNRTAPQVASAPRQESAQPAGSAASPASAPPAATTPPVVETPDRPIVQDIVSPAESARLQADTARFRQEITQRLAKLRRRLSPQQEELRQNINAFVKQSDQAQQQGETRKANELASKALVLAKALSDGR